MNELNNFQDLNTTSKKSTNIVAILFITVMLLIIGVVIFRNTSGETFSVTLSEGGEFPSIPEGTKVLKLVNGDITYTLERKEKLYFSRYLVSMIDIFKNWDTDISDSIEYFSASYELYPYDEKHRRALEMSKDLNEKGSFDIPVGSEEEGQEIIDLMNDLESEKINTMIMPANTEVLNKSKEVVVNDIVIVSGIYFKYSKVEQKGVEQNMSLCLQNVDLFFVTDMSVTK
jgi:hypothetical protein